MVIDSSAILAILLQEPDAWAYARAIRDDRTRLMAAPSVLETSIVADARFGAGGLLHLDALIERSRIEVVPFSAQHLSYAREAFRHYGKGRHAASLNFGDCMAYALSKYSGEPLLFKGNDFAGTDVDTATVQNQR